MEREGGQAAGTKSMAQEGSLNDRLQCMSTQTARQCRKHVHKAKAVLLAKIVSRDKGLSLTRLLHVLLCTKSHAKQDPCLSGTAPPKVSTHRATATIPSHMRLHDVGGHPPFP
jgi:hypothetical protein